MRNFFYLLLAGLMGMSGVVNAQQSRKIGQMVRCNTMEADARLRANNPGMGTLEDFENWLAPLVREYKQNPANQSSRAVTTIPIIFHVIHDNDPVGSGDNISATLINAQVQQLNNDFRKILGTSGYNSNPVGADSEIEFCLATVDPNGNPLSEAGINRINRSSKGWTAPPYGTCGGGFNDAYIEGTIKPNSQWNPNDYFNVWVMDINCGILGYAQFPSSSGLGGLNSNGGAASTDGVVLLTSSVGSTTNPNPSGGSYNKGRTGTHEIGHFFGLRHIWGDGGCSVDDFCGDTPSSDAANYGCPNTSSCGSTDMVENYMDYTDDNCMNIFTADQKARMQTVLANSPRRGSLGNSTACGGGTPPPSGCASTVTSFPYSEGFESSFGAWTQASGDDFDWSRRSGATPSSNTGPTSAAQGSFYAYIESSTPNYSTKTSILESPCFDLSGASTATLTFESHLYGAATMGSLSLEAKPDGGNWASVWSKTGNQGNAWGSESVDLSSYAGATMQLRFVGVTGTTWQGDMAVDDLSLTTTTGGGGSFCGTTISSFPYSEGFESSFGAWSQASGDDFDWSRLSGSTPSSNTGPASASEGNFYAYTESSSPNYSTKAAILNGPCFDLTGESAADFSFQYHLYGAATMGSLALQASTNGTNWTTVWSRSGNQGNAWQSASVDLSAYAGSTVQLRYNGVTGTTWQGDMAVDDIALTTSSGSSCQDLTLTLTFDNYPEETSWSLENLGTTIASGGTYASEPDGSTLVLTIPCVADGCYDFIINDVYGDGICCTYGNGSYTLRDASNNVLASGGSFTSSETTSFCLPNGNRLGLTQFSGEGLTLYPVPAQNRLNVRFDAGNETPAVVTVVDLMGRELTRTDWLVQAGRNEQFVDLNVVPNGTYLMVIRQGDKVNSKRFVVQK